MDNKPPDQLLLSWLSDLPQRHRETLVRRYIFMTSADSADFSLSGEAAWQHFKKQLLEPEFPLRRVARLLMARVLLTFLLERFCSDFQQTSLSVENADTLPSFDAAHLLRASQHLHELCETELSDAALQDWLMFLQE